MKKFLICKSSEKSWSSATVFAEEKHVIIYCKDLKTVFETWSQLGADVQAVTIHVFTEDPTLSINPYFVNLTINTNIRKVKFNCYTHDFWLRLILDTCPNLESLYFFKLTKSKVKYAAENLEHLQHLYCDYIEDDVVEYYKKMKVDDKSLNGEIKIN